MGACLCVCNCGLVYGGRVLYVYLTIMCVHSFLTTVSIFLLLACFVSSFLSECL